MSTHLQPWHLLALIPGLFAAASAGGLSGCDTDPVNPDGCEAIETARCQAAPACEAFGSNFDVESCERFYRDQCLKGLQSASDPGKPRIDECVRAIERAGECARRGVSPCNVGSGEINDPCSLIVAPEQHTECGFLDDGYEKQDGGVSPFQDAASDAASDAEADGGQDAATDGNG